MNNVIGSKVKVNLSNYYEEENYLRDNIRALREVNATLEAKIAGNRESVRTLIAAGDVLTKEDILKALKALLYV